MTVSNSNTRPAILLWWRKYEEIFPFAQLTSLRRWEALAWPSACKKRKVSQQTSNSPVHKETRLKRTDSKQNRLICTIIMNCLLLESGRVIFGIGHTPADSRPKPMQARRYLAAWRFWGRKPSPSPRPRQDKTGSVGSGT